MYAVRKQHLGFMLLEPVAAVWPPLYQMWLLLSPILSLGVLPKRRANSNWHPCSARTGHWNKAVSQGQIPSGATSKEECFTLGCGQHGLQVTSTTSYWSTGLWEWRKTDQQPKESLWRETGRNTLQFFKSRSVSIIAAGLQESAQRLPLAFSTNFMGFLKISLTLIWIFFLYKYEKFKEKEKVIRICLLNI